MISRPNKASRYWVCAHDSSWEIWTFRQETKVEQIISSPVRPTTKPLTVKQIDSKCPLDCQVFAQFRNCDLLSPDVVTLLHCEGKASRRTTVEGKTRSAASYLEVVVYDYISFQILIQLIWVVITTITINQQLGLA